MEKLAKPQEAVLKLKRVYFDEILYQFHADMGAELSYTFDFDRGIEEAGENSYRIFLRCNVCDEGNRVELHVEVVGEFECAVGDKEFRQKLLNENAIAILFPYLRSQICLVTTQPDTIPINLPAINILSLFEK